MKIRIHSPHRRAIRGFTLVELIVSTALIAGIMLLLLGTVDQTQRVYKRSVSKTTQFQAARAAFDAMSRRLSQATLNTYWKAHEASIAASADKAEFKFRRQSDLQFISGPTKRVFGASLANLNTPLDENYPGHSVFFSAPIGHTEYVDPSVTKNPGKLKMLRSLDSTLAACGYFVEFGDDPAIPSALRNGNPPYPPRNRYRLMEMTVPSESFNIYWRDDLGTDPTWDINPRTFDEKKNYYGGLVDKDRQPIGAFVRPYWMARALIRPTQTKGGINQFQYAHSIAENIVALIVLPKLAVKDRVKVGTKTPDPDVLELAPKYEFDSWRVLSGGTESDPDPTHVSVKLDNRARDNLLPPIVQLTMVAIDEPSAIRMDLKATGKPKWFDTLFVDGKSELKYIEDAAKLEEAIRDDKDHPNIQYRIFTTDVIIRGSKWSREPKP